MSDFDQKKLHILKEIGLNSEENPDASPKGTIDDLCIPLITLINGHKDMVTTSSCSGRLSVFLEGRKQNKELTEETTDQTVVRIGAKGDGGRWLFVSHEKEDIIDWWKKEDIMLKYDTDIDDSTYSHNTRYVLFKYEPLILHVKCRDFKTASALYSTAMGCGFRESGIGANNNVAIRISIRLDIPIGFMNSDEQIVSVVDESYIRMITKLAYHRFLENERKMELLRNRIDEEIMQVNHIELPMETKEERKLRKMQEGLARRDEVRKLKEEKRRLKLIEQQKEIQSNSNT